MGIKALISRDDFNYHKNDEKLSGRFVTFRLWKRFCLSCSFWWWADRFDSHKIEIKNPSGETSRRLRDDVMVKCDGQPSRPSPLPELALDSVSWGGDTSWSVGCPTHMLREGVQCFETILGLASCLALIVCFDCDNFYFTFSLSWLWS